MSPVGVWLPVQARSGCCARPSSSPEVSTWLLQGVLLYGPPGTGKTLLARAVAHHTDCTFIRVSGSELVQKFIGEGKRARGEAAACAGAPARAPVVLGVFGTGLSRGVQGRRKPCGCAELCVVPGLSPLCSPQAPAWCGSCL